MRSVVRELQGHGMASALLCVVSLICHNQIESVGIPTRCKSERWSLVVPQHGLSRECACGPSYACAMDPFEVDPRGYSPYIRVEMRALDHWLPRIISPKPTLAGGLLLFGRLVCIAPWNDGEKFRSGFAIGHFKNRLVENLIAVPVGSCSLPPDA